MSRRAHYRTCPLCEAMCGLAGLPVAARHAGVNSNILAPGGLVDPLSNNAVVNGIPVTVTPTEHSA